MPHAGKITTVLEDRDPAGLSGLVLAHEHLRIDLSREEDPAGLIADDEAVLSELARARERYGLGLVVELTCQGMGRDVASLSALSEKSGVAVVCSTGFYYERFHPDYVEVSTVEDLVSGLISEIVDGVDGSGVRPGVIGEVGSGGERMSPDEEKCFRAAARAALATGLPISTHAHLGSGALGQLELLMEEGVPPERISLGHQDLTDDFGQHRMLAETGAYVAFDTVGKESYQPDDARLRLVLQMLEAGHGDRLLLSNDISRETYLAKNGGIGYSHLFRSFVPRLCGAGVDERTLTRLLDENPKRFLTRTGGERRGA